MNIRFGVISPYFSAQHSRPRVRFGVVDGLPEATGPLVRGADIVTHADAGPEPILPAAEEPVAGVEGPSIPGTTNQVKGADHVPSRGEVLEDPRQA